MKLFSTKDMFVVKCCQEMFKIDLPSVIKFKNNNLRKD